MTTYLIPGQAAFERETSEERLARRVRVLEEAMEATEHLDPPAPLVRCHTPHFDIVSGQQCPRCQKVVHRDHLGREINHPEKVIPRLSQPCQYTNHNHCDGRSVSGPCPCKCHKAPAHLDNPAASFGRDDS